jgi:hypothetical protein
MPKGLEVAMSVDSKLEIEVAAERLRITQGSLVASTDS